VRDFLGELSGKDSKI